ncbi:DHH family phosphoesterase [Desulfovibrio litoralis]|uniref:DHH family protein n=1 Tax=Desulfovibrio litoralis DSM 11393 TaxID=1121455 RepID=A0A1M7SAA0_9BACT|nr:DHH family phosphoesterase [Desulfovibrio litoralis]SHN55202.1 DHH family protein [Desulfovibrio litoralis DSM 11393]
MAYFKQLGNKVEKLLALFKREERWLILISADPDALASASALKRIMLHKTGDVRICAINAVSRPDNLAMIRYTNIKLLEYAPELLKQFDRFAIVDSQASHSPLFKDINFSIVIDHHPLSECSSVSEFSDIRPDYGATSTMMMEYLHNLGIKPSKNLATAMLFGIKTDTASFQRKFCDADIRAYHYLTKFSDQVTFNAISKSEMHYRWLAYFAKACQRLKKVGTGHFVFIDRVDNPDVLVGIADFFMRVYEISWVSVAGVYQDNLIIIFRSCAGRRNLGAFAHKKFGDVGSAGGHKTMARAEIPVSAIPGFKIERFILNRLLPKSVKQKNESKIVEEADKK